MKHLKTYEELKKISGNKFTEPNKDVEKSVDYLEHDIIELIYNTLKNEFGGKGYKGNLSKPEDTKLGEWAVNLLDNSDEDRPTIYTFLMIFFPYKLFFQFRKRDEYELFIYIHNMSEIETNFLTEESVYELDDIENQIDEIVKLINEYIENYIKLSGEYLHKLLLTEPKEFVKNKDFFIDKVKDLYKDDVETYIESEELGLL